MTIDNNASNETTPAEDDKPRKSRLFRPMTLTLGVAAAALILVPLGFAVADDMRGGWHGKSKHHMGRGFGPRAERMVDRMFERADTNDDGVISAEEIVAVQAERFKRIDRDGNGEVTLQEIADMQDAARQARRDMRASRGISRVGGFVEADADNNGSISAAEFAAIPHPRLERLDANDDGDISREEVEAMKQQMRDRRGFRGGRDSDRDG